MQVTTAMAGMEAMAQTDENAQCLLIVQKLKKKYKEVFDLSTI